MTDSSPDFAGKVVAIYVVSPPAGMDSGVLLEYAEFRTIEGRRFLVGRIPSWNYSGWISHLQAGVAWDSVVHFLIFDSREDYEQRAVKVKSPSMFEKPSSPSSS